MADYIYYTVIINDDLELHIKDSVGYNHYLFLENESDFRKQLKNLLESTDTIISYRGGHIEKPLIIAFQVLDQVGLKSEDIIKVLQEINRADGSPTVRLTNSLKEYVSETSYYQAYLDLLTKENWLDIETFDGRIYHNDFQRLELQSQLPIAKTREEYLCHLELIFQSEAFQKVYQEKEWLIETFSNDYHIPVNTTTTDAQLTESYYTNGKLNDARQVFIPREYLPFRYFLKNELLQLFETYQMRNPKSQIKKRFGQLGAVTVLNEFVVLSAASAPIGYHIPNFTKEKSWTSQVKTKRCEKAIRVDFTHIQARIMQSVVKNPYFQKQLRKVLKRWDRQPEQRLALNRLLYPIQGAMDTPFEHDLHTPNYAYSMRIVHNLLLIGLLETLTADGFKPISLNNEVIFFDADDFDRQLFERRADVLGIYYDYRPITRLIIKDTNNYTYFDEVEQKQVFRGASFNHHDGADVTTNMDSPPIVDYILKEMIIRYGQFKLSKIPTLLEEFLNEETFSTIKEFFMIPIYPIRNRWHYLYRGSDYQLVSQAKAFYASKHHEAWDYFPIYQSKRLENDVEVQAFVQRYGLELSKNSHKLNMRLFKAEEIEILSLERIDLSYYQALIQDEINLWR